MNAPLRLASDHQHHLRMSHQMRDVQARMHRFIAKAKLSPEWRDQLSEGADSLGECARLQRDEAHRVLSNPFGMQDQFEVLDHSSEPESSTVEVELNQAEMLRIADVFGAGSPEPLVEIMQSDSNNETIVEQREALFRNGRVLLDIEQDGDATEAFEDMIEEMRDMAEAHKDHREALMDLDQDADLIDDPSFVEQISSQIAWSICDYIDQYLCSDDPQWNTSREVLLHELVHNESEQRKLMERVMNRYFAQSTLEWADPQLLQGAVAEAIEHKISELDEPEDVETEPGSAAGKHEQLPTLRIRPQVSEELERSQFQDALLRMTRLEKELADGRMLDPREVQEMIEEGHSWSRIQSERKLPNVADVRRMERDAHEIFQDMQSCTVAAPEQRQAAFGLQHRLELLLRLYTVQANEREGVLSDTERQLLTASVTELKQFVRDRDLEREEKERVQSAYLACELLINADEDTDAEAFWMLIHAWDKLDVAFRSVSSSLQSFMNGTSGNTAEDAAQRLSMVG